MNGRQIFRKFLTYRQFDRGISNRKLTETEIHSPFLDTVIQFEYSFPLSSFGKKKTRLSSDWLSFLYYKEKKRTNCDTKRTMHKEKKCTYECNKVN